MLDGLWRLWLWLWLRLREDDVGDGGVNGVGSELDRKQWWAESWGCAWNEKVGLAESGLGCSRKNQSSSQQSSLGPLLLVLTVALWMLVRRSKRSRSRRASRSRLSARAMPRPT